MNLDTSKHNLFETEIVKSLSEKYQKSEGQIILNWAISQGMIVIPKANSGNRIKENLESQNFTLSNEDIEAISKLDENKRFCYKQDQHNNYNVFV